MKARESVELWIVAYGGSRSMISPSTVLGVFSAADRALSLVERSKQVNGSSSSIFAQQSKDNLPHTTTAIHDDCYKWIETQLAAVAVCSDDVRLVAVSGKSASGFLWHLDSCISVQIETNDISPRVDATMTLVVSLPSELSDGSVVETCSDIASILLSDRDVWYAHINPVVSGTVSYAYAYQGILANGNWSQVLERRTWTTFVLPQRAMPRGVYWGNVFGTQLWNRLQAAGLSGYLGDASAFREDYIPRSVKGEHGGMALFLDDEPLRFARLQSPESNDCDIYDRAAWTGAALRAAIRDCS